MAWQWYYNKTDWCWWFIFQNWFNIMWEMHNKGLLQLHWSTHFLGKRDFNVGLMVEQCSVWLVHIIIHVSNTSKVQCEDIREDESVEVEVITIWVTRKTEILKFQHFLSTPSITIKWSETHPPVNKHYHRLNFKL